MKLLSFAEIIWDVYPDTSVIGGSGLNFAAHASMCGMDAWVMSAVGHDSFGDNAMLELDKFNLNKSFVKRNDFETGKCMVTLDKNGVPSFNVLKNVAYDNISVSDEDIEIIKREGFDAFYFGTLQQRSAVSRASILKILESCHFGEVFCDMNLRGGCYDEESVKNVLSHATILKLSDEEAPLLDAFDFWKKKYSGADFAARIFEDFPQIHTILYTQGIEGSVVYLNDGEMIYIPAVKVKAVSTVGAGDSYGAAYLSTYLMGKCPLDCGTIAAAVSSAVVAVKAAVPVYKLKDILGKH